MVLWFQLALRNVTRNVRRTLLTAATIVVGTALVTLALAWLSGVFGSIIAEYTAATGHLRLVTKNFAERESLQPLYENIAAAAPVLAALRAIPGVVAAEPRITTGVVLSVGEEIGDNFGQVVGGTAAYYRTYLQGPQKVLSGAWLSGAPKETVLGRKLAEQLKAKVGDKILLMGQTQDGSLSSISARMVGVVGGDALLDQQAFLGLEDARYLTDMAGGALEILVWTRSLEPAVVGPVARQLTGLPALAGLTVQPWYEREPLASMLPLLSGVKSFIQLLIVFMAALAIFNTMTMSVLERTTEIGVLRAMGLTRLGAVGLFVLEGLVIGLVGGIGGTLLGAIPAYYFQLHGVTLAEDMIEKVGTLPIHATLHAQLTTGIMVQSIVIGLGIAVVGAFLPALRAASIRPVVAMHARR